MAKYIERDRLIEDLTELAKYQTGERQQGILGVIETIRIRKAADVEPVRHAHWIECDDYYDGGLHLSEYKCNICGAPEAMFYGKYPTYKYCHCGAKMDEKE